MLPRGPFFLSRFRNRLGGFGERELGSEVGERLTGSGLFAWRRIGELEADREADSVDGGEVNVALAAQKSFDGAAVDAGGGRDGGGGEAAVGDCLADLRGDRLARDGHGERGFGGHQEARG